MKFAIVRHNLKVPFYYPKCSLVYDINESVLEERDRSGNIIASNRFQERAEVGRYMKGYGIDVVIACIDFTNADTYAKLRIDIATLACIGDTHHGVNPISRIRDAMKDVPVLGVVLLFTPAHARLFNDIANVYYVEGLCPTLPFIFKRSANWKDSPKESIALTGSTGGFHGSRRLVFENLINKALIREKKVGYLAGDLDTLGNFYKNSMICINIPISVDVNQRHWEILASGGVPLLLRGSYAAFDGLLRHLSGFRPGLECGTVIEKVEWSIENYSTLKMNAIETVNYLHKVVLDGAEWVERIMGISSERSSEVNIYRWQKTEVDYNSRRLRDKVTKEIEKGYMDKSYENSMGSKRLINYLEEARPEVVGARSKQ